MTGAEQQQARALRTRPAQAADGTDTESPSLEVVSVPHEFARQCLVYTGQEGALRMHACSMLQWSPCQQPSSVNPAYIHRVCHADTSWIRSIIRKKSAGSSTMYSTHALPTLRTDASHPLSSRVPALQAFWYIKSPQASHNDMHIQTIRAVQAHVALTLSPACCAARQF